MGNDASVPYMSSSQLFYLVQSLFGKIIHFATPVFFQSSVHLITKSLIPKQTGKYLINNHLLFHSRIVYRFINPTFKFNLK